MAKLTVLKKWISKDGSRLVEIEARDSGLFSFRESILREDNSPIGSQEYWSPNFQSGSYESAADAETEARATIHWLNEAAS